MASGSGIHAAGRYYDVTTLGRTATEAVAEVVAKRRARPPFNR
jgi:hypothetical protein